MPPWVSSWVGRVGYLPPLRLYDEWWHGLYGFDVTIYSPPTLGCSSVCFSHDRLCQCLRGCGKGAF
jgi:hypothetical protein